MTTNNNKCDCCGKIIEGRTYHIQGLNLCASCCIGAGTQAAQHSVE